MDKIKALFTTGSGLALVLTFVVGGLTALQSHLTGNALADVTTILSIIGIFYHPTEMVGGKAINR